MLIVHSYSRHGAFVRKRFMSHDDLNAKWHFHLDRAKSVAECLDNLLFIIPYKIKGKSDGKDILIINVSISHISLILLY